MDQLRLQPLWRRPRQWLTQARWHSNPDPERVGSSSQAFQPDPGAVVQACRHSDADPGAVVQACRHSNPDPGAVVKLAGIPTPIPEPWFVRVRAPAWFLQYGRWNLKYVFRVDLAVSVASS